MFLAVLSLPLFRCCCWRSIDSLVLVCAPSNSEWTRFNAGQSTTHTKKGNKRESPFLFKNNMFSTDMFIPKLEVWINCLFDSWKWWWRHQMLAKWSVKLAFWWSSLGGFHLLSSPLCWWSEKQQQKQQQPPLFSSGSCNNNYYEQGCALYRLGEREREGRGKNALWGHAKVHSIERDRKTSSPTLERKCVPLYR